MILSNLPNELIEGIILQLPPSQMALSRLICKLFQSTVDHSAKILLQIELFIQGLLPIENPGHRASAKKLLQDIKFQRDRFQRFLPTQTFTFNTPPDWESYSIYGGILAITRERNRVHFWELSQDPSQIPWKHDINLEMYELLNFDSWSFDVSLDLFIFVENSNPLWRIQLRSLINNSPHPLATQPFLEVKFEDFQMGCDIEVVGEKLGIIFFDESDREAVLQLFNWKTGAVLNNLTQVTSFKFLDSNPLATSTQLNSLIYSSNQGCIFLEFTIQIEEMIISSSPPRRSQNIPFLRSQKWCQDSDTEVFAISIRCPSYSDSGYSAFVIIISEIKLLEVIKLRLSTLGVAPTTQSERTISWSDWGPNCTRWIPSLDEYDLDIPSISGSCVALMAPPSRSYSSPLPANRIETSSDVNCLHILDFNPRPIHRVEEAQSETSFSMRVITEPWTYRGLGEVDITCRLPFRSFTSNTNYRSRNVVLNDDLLIEYSDFVFNVLTFEAL